MKFWINPPPSFFFYCKIIFSRKSTSLHPTMGSFYFHRSIWIEMEFFYLNFKVVNSHHCTLLIPFNITQKDIAHILFIFSNQWAVLETFHHCLTFAVPLWWILYKCLLHKCWMCVVTAKHLYIFFFRWCCTCVRGRTREDWKEIRTLINVHKNLYLHDITFLK